MLDAIKVAPSDFGRDTKKLKGAFWAGIGSFLMLAGFIWTWNHPINNGQSIMPLLVALGEIVGIFLFVMGAITYKEA